MNKTHLIGYLVQGPIHTHTQEGTTATLVLALHESWRDARDGWQKKTEWHQVTVVKPTIVTWLRQNTKRGDLLFVQGSFICGECEESPTGKKKTPHIVVKGRATQIVRIWRNNDHNNRDLTREEPLSPYIGDPK